MCIRDSPYRLAVYHYHKEEFPKSLQIIVKLLEEKEDIEWAYLAWGNLYSKQGKQDEAIKKWKKALEINPSFDKPLYGLGSAYSDRGEYGEAMIYFEKMIEKDAENWYGWNGLANCYKRLENKEKAIAAYDKTIEIEPEYFGGYLNKASYLLEELQDTAGAVHLFQKGAEVTPDGIEKYMSLAGAYFAMGKHEEMMASAHKALEIDPNNSRVNMNLIQILSYKKQYAKALNYLAAIRTIPNDVRGDSRWHKQKGLYLLAQCSYLLNKYEQAEVLAKESIAVDSNYGFPYTILAETYSLMGKDELFYKTLEAAFKRGVTFEELMNDAPYQRFLNKKRFKDLVEKYLKKTEPLDQVAKS